LKWGLAVLLLVGFALLTNLSFRERQAQKEIARSLTGSDRFVDFGIVLHTVVKDEQGAELIAGSPKLRIVRTHRFGGIYDTLTKQWAGASRSPVVWFVSVEQEPIVLHADQMPAGVWMQGSMGAGKTTAGAIWLALRVVKHATHPLKGAGVTAPTDKRMEEIRKTLFGSKDRDGERVGGMWPRAWFSWREGDQVCTMATGLQIDFRSTHIQSAAAGSPIQGQNWAFVLNDELQDYYELDGDIQMRGRAAWKGRYERFVTVTPKDDPGYRTFRDNIATLDKDWVVQPVLGPNSPFISEEHWERVRRGLTDREYQRKVMAIDVPAENRLYVTWDRSRNLRPWPRVGSLDVTAKELARFGFPNGGMLVGYDPGRIYDVSVFLRAYLPRGAKSGQAPDWYVVDEVTTKRSTTDRHGMAVLEALKRWGCNVYAGGPMAFVRCDPYTRTGTDTEHPDITVYKKLESLGLTVKPAAYGPGALKPGKVPPEARIDMLNTLFHAADGATRLFVSCDESGTPAAKRLVDALERSDDNNVQRKDEHDLSHWPCALAYALWAIEKPRLDDIRRLG